MEVDLSDLIASILYVRHNWRQMLASCTFKPVFLFIPLNVMTYFAGGEYNEVNFRNFQ